MNIAFEGTKRNHAWTNIVASCDQHFCLAYSLVTTEYSAAIVVDSK